MSNKTILISKRLVKIVSTLKQLTSKESCLIKIKREIMSRSRVFVSITQSDDRNQEN
jgi:hypothetical protein